MQPYTQDHETESLTTTAIFTPKSHETMIHPLQEQHTSSTTRSAQGTVKWFNEKKGFGFIVDPTFDGDIFVHYSEIQIDGFKTLQENDKVEYELYTDDKGAKARHVVRIS